MMTNLALASSRIVRGYLARRRVQHLVELRNASALRIQNCWRAGLGMYLMRQRWLQMARQVSSVVHGSSTAAVAATQRIAIHALYLQERARQEAERIAAEEAAIALTKAKLHAGRVVSPPPSRVMMMVQRPP